MSKKPPKKVMGAASPAEPAGIAGLETKWDKAAVMILYNLKKLTNLLVIAEDSERLTALQAGCSEIFSEAAAGVSKPPEGYC